MASAKQIANRVRTVAVFAIIKEFRRAKIIERIIQAAKANDHISSGALITPETSGSIIPSRDDLWLTPRKKHKRLVSVRVYTNQFDVPSTINLRVNLGDYGLDYKYMSLAKKPPKRESSTNPFAQDNVGGDMIDRVMYWMENKMDRGYSFYYMKNDGTRVPLAQGDRVNRPRAAFPIMRKLASEGPEQTNFADAFRGRYGVETVLKRASSKVQDGIYNSIAETVQTNLENIF